MNITKKRMFNIPKKGERVGVQLHSHYDECGEVRYGEYLGEEKDFHYIRINKEIIAKVKLEQIFK